MNVDLRKPLLQFQQLLNDLLTLLPNLLLGAAVMLVTYVFARYAAKLVRLLIQRTGHNATAGLLLGRIAHYTVFIVGFLVALSTVFPGFNAKDLVQVLGLGGVAIGFAFKDIFQNFLAGVIIIVSRPFRIGDTIVVKGFEGVVEDIQTRATMIRTGDNQRVVVPNTVLFTEEVRVVTAYETRKTEIEFSIGYAADVPAVKAAILAGLASVEGVEAEPVPEVLARGFDDAGVKIRLGYWAAPARGNLLFIRDAVVLTVKDALARIGVEIPSPVRTVVLQEAASDAPTETTA